MFAPLPLSKTVRGLACVRCGRLSRDPWQWWCPTCGPDARMDVQYQADAAALMMAGLDERPHDQWRYAELLPVAPDMPRPPLPTGWTPVVESARLATWLGVRRALIKDEGRNPSASLKDRASAVAVAMAIATGADRVVCASAGNAASSLAAMAASVGLPATIFVPKRAPAPKVAQLRTYGAQVFRVDADYDRTWDLCAAVAHEVERSGRQRWFNRNSAQNPYLIEGKKTAGLELAEQLGERLPGWVAVSVGDGCTVAGIIKGLEEAFEAGLAPHVPRVLAVQALGASPLVQAWRDGGPPLMDGVETVADGICVGHPRNAERALAALRRVQGEVVAVHDRSILEAISGTASRCGVFAEPAGAAAVAGVAEAVRRGIIERDEDVVIVITGNGLKDTGAALRAVTGPTDVPANIDVVLTRLGL